MNLEPNQLIDDRYKIIERLGQGGMGAVWKAEDQQLGDKVIIKMPLLGSDPTVLQRFASEATLMRKYSIHAHILDIQSVGDIDGIPFYVMRYLSGGSLEGRCPAASSGGLSEFKVESFEWVRSIGKALDYLHSKGVLHRDVKPANILFSESNDAYLADFGIAKNPTEVTNFTQGPTAPGTSPGTFGYMAPEVLYPEPENPVGGAIDQYALAVTVHEAIAGKRPFDATNVIKLYHQTQEGCAPLSDTIPNVPTGASQAVMRALSSKPGQRFESCAAFAEAYLDGLRNLNRETGSRTSEEVGSSCAVEAETEPVDSDGTRELDVEKYKQELAQQKRNGGLDFTPPDDCGAKPIAHNAVSSTAVEKKKFGNRALRLLRNTIILSLLVAVVLQVSGYFRVFTFAYNCIEHLMPFSVAASPVTTNSIGMKFRLIPAGKSQMGSPANEHGRRFDEHQHAVEITRDFYLGETEVTQRQWKAVMGTEPWKGKDLVEEGDDNPAVYVSWDDAVAFCEKLSEQEGKEYRLPTEAEWEYACRGGSQLAYSFGSDSDELGKHAWFKKNAYDIGEKYAHQVGQKRANGFGLHDMHGNVWEWCSDWYAMDYYQESPGQDPAGPASGSSRVLRGGSWALSMSLWRSAGRGNDDPSIRDHDVGFRVVSLSGG